jgi:hypothetical protein
LREQMMTGTHPSCWEVMTAGWEEWLFVASVAGK